jgi:cytochrome c oxidase subunit II
LDRDDDLRPRHGLSDLLPAALPGHRPGPGRRVDPPQRGLDRRGGLAAAEHGARARYAIIGGPDADIDVEVRAQQFSWEFYYPKANQFGAKLYLEKGKRHRIILTSKDVVHSFWVPELRLKQDAVPGKIIPLLLTPTVTGDYTLLCSQLCGMEHTDMTSSVQVLDHEDFEKALKAEF